jgi:hypothetical protein
MAKYCTKCGHALRDGDKFCAECGKPIDGPASSPQRPRGETCDITYREVKPAALFTKAQGQYVAVAQGRVGRYVVAESAVFALAANAAPDYDEPEHVAALTALIKRLIADGWTALPDKVSHPVFGDLWYGYRFYRLVRS